MTLGEYIKNRRNGIYSQKDFAKLSGISVSYLCELESGQKLATDDLVRKIAAGFDLDDTETEEILLLAALDRTPERVLDKLSSRDKEIDSLKRLLSGSSDNLSYGYFAPVYESVSAGTGKYAYGEAIDFLPVPENVKRSGNIVYFKVNGDSMEPDIKNGSYVLIKEGIMPEQGQEGVFVLEDEWFVKTYRKIGDTIILSSLNRNYKDIEIELNDGVNFRCIGKVAGVFNFY